MTDRTSPCRVCGTPVPYATKPRLYCDEHRRTTDAGRKRTERAASRGELIPWNPTWPSFAVDPSLVPGLAPADGRSAVFLVSTADDVEEVEDAAIRLNATPALPPSPPRRRGRSRRRVKDATEAAPARGDRWNDDARLPRPDDAPKVVQRRLAPKKPKEATEPEAQARAIERARGAGVIGDTDPVRVSPPAPRTE
jgi:hypothetical protein